MPLNKNPQSFKSPQHQSQSQPPLHHQPLSFQRSKNLYKQSQTLSYDEQFQQTFQLITRHKHFNDLNKHTKIRINKWLTKLANISVNQVWKRNRNNYLRLIKLMFDNQVVIKPFVAMPPERDLPKLTHHQIGVIEKAVERAAVEKVAALVENKENLEESNDCMDREIEMILINDKRKRQFNSKGNGVQSFLQQLQPRNSNLKKQSKHKHKHTSSSSFSLITDGASSRQMMKQENKVIWTQQSMYIDYQHKQKQKYKSKDKSINNNKQSKNNNNNKQNKSSSSSYLQSNPNFKKSQQMLNKKSLSFRGKPQHQPQPQPQHQHQPQQHELISLLQKQKNIRKQYFNQQLQKRYQQQHHGSYNNNNKKHVEIEVLPQSQQQRIIKPKPNQSSNSKNLSNPTTTKVIKKVITSNANTCHSSSVTLLGEGAFMSTSNSRQREQAGYYHNYSTKSRPPVAPSKASHQQPVQRLITFEETFQSADADDQTENNYENNNNNNNNNRYQQPHQQQSLSSSAPQWQQQSLEQDSTSHSVLMMRQRANANANTQQLELRLNQQDQYQIRQWEKGRGNINNFELLQLEQQQKLSQQQQELEQEQSAISAISTNFYYPPQQQQISQQHLHHPISGSYTTNNSNNLTTSELIDKGIRFIMQNVPNAGQDPKKIIALQQQSKETYTNDDEYSDEQGEDPQQYSHALSLENEQMRQIDLHIPVVTTQSVANTKTNNKQKIKILSSSISSSHNQFQV